MKADLNHPLNQGIVRYLREGSEYPPQDPAGPLGTHPDILDRFWELAAAVPRRCRGTVCGARAVVHPKTGVIVALACGTCYCLRVGAELTAARSAGARQSKMTRQFGRDWIEGGWHHGETDWLRAGFQAAGEATTADPGQGKAGHGVDGETAFLAAIRDDPDDDARRLVYADWLEERGDPKAEFLRLQCQHARTWFEAISVSGDRDCQRMEQLEQEHGERWLAEVPRVPGIQWGLWRGLPAWVRVRGWTDFNRHARRLFRAAPIEYVTFERLTAAGAWALGESPYLRRLRVLDLGYGAIGSVAALDALLAAPRLAGLTTLRLFHSPLGDELAMALAQCPFLSGLKLLSVYSSEIDDAGALAIARSRYLKNVGFIELGRNRFGDRAERALVERFGDRVNI